LEQNAIERESGKHVRKHASHFEEAHASGTLHQWQSDQNRALRMNKVSLDDVLSEGDRLAADANESQHRNLAAGGSSEEGTYLKLDSSHSWALSEDPKGNSDALTESFVVPSHQRVAARWEC
jgi:hypothetical protein